METAQVTITISIPVFWEHSSSALTKADAVQHQLVKRLERLSFKITPEAQPQAA